MARFYASIQGARGEATRMGTPASGITGHIRGWDIGVYVYCDVRNGEDYIQVALTSGSNRNGYNKTIWEGTRKDYDDLVA